MWDRNGYWPRSWQHQMFRHGLLPSGRWPSILASRMNTDRTGATWSVVAGVDLGGPHYSCTSALVTALTSHPRNRGDMLLLVTAIERMLASFFVRARSMKSAIAMSSIGVFVEASAERDGSTRRHAARRDWANLQASVKGIVPASPMVVHVRRPLQWA